MSIIRQTLTALLALVRSHALAVSRLSMHVAAASALVMIVWLFVLIWPIPLLGYTYDLVTAELIAVAPESPADRAGIHVGDQLVALYGQPWEVVQRHPNVLALLGPLDQPIPILIARDGIPIPLAIRVGPPDPAFQTVKLIHLGLALLCWLTGYLLGVVHRAQAGVAREVAGFWLIMSVLVMGYLFSVMASLPLWLAIQWLLLTILAPFAVLMHTSYPVRMVDPTRRARVRRWFGASVLALNGAMLLAVLLWQPALGTLILRLSLLLPPALLVAFLASGALLLREYRLAISAHVRRQIRLIGVACLMVGVGWLLFLIVPLLVGDLARFTNQASNGIIALIPLAYLIGGITPDLYRIDRLARRAAGHLVTLSLLIGLATAGVRGLAVQGAPLLLLVIIAGITCYQPVWRLVLRMLGEPAADGNYRPLAAATHQLTTTLDSAALVQAIITGVRAAFAQPALACYLADGDGMRELRLIAQEHLADLPDELSSAALVTALVGTGRVSEGQTIASAVGAQPLTDAEARLLHHPALVLWGPIRHADGHLLGLLVLGSRGDLDQYRLQDRQELQRLCDAAALAFAHSSAYQQRQEAEELNRALLRDLQTAQEDAGAQLAHALHDDIINERLRINIQALHQIIPELPASELRDELELILKSEEKVVDALRMICEDLRPMAVEDPQGLAAVVRIRLERALVTWPGSWAIEERHQAVPLAPTVQHEVVRIVGEAATNVDKHAAATQLWVTLCYPAQPGQPLEVVVRDNGVGCSRARPAPGHRGLRAMRERARQLGGSLELWSAPGVGTTVTLRCPVATEAEASTERHGAEDVDAAPTPSREVERWTS